LQFFEAPASSGQQAALTPAACSGEVLICIDRANRRCRFSARPKHATDHPVSESASVPRPSGEATIGLRVVHEMNAISVPGAPSRCVRP